MAKSRSRNGVRRVALDNASGIPLLDPGELLRSGRELLSLEDRRTFYPSPVYRPAARLDRGMRAFLSMPGVKRQNLRSRFSSKVKFSDPQSVVICVRRHRRKEVLFAKKKAGRGGMRKPRRNAFSNISCKR